MRWPTRSTNLATAKSLRPEPVGPAQRRSDRARRADLPALVLEIEVTYALPSLAGSAAQVVWARRVGADKVQEALRYRSEVDAAAWGRFIGPAHAGDWLARRHCTGLALLLKARRLPALPPVDPL